MILAFDRARYPAAYLLQRVSEKQVQAAVMSDLSRRGITAWVVDAGAVRRAGGRAVVGVKGMSDIIGYLPDGRALFIECKAPAWRKRKPCDHPFHPPALICNESNQVRAAGKLSPEQEQFLINAEKAGCCIGVCWHPGDLNKIFAEDLPK